MKVKKGDLLENHIGEYEVTEVRTEVVHYVEVIRKKDGRKQRFRIYDGEQCHIDHMARDPKYEPSRFFKKKNGRKI